MFKALLILPCAAFFVWLASMAFLYPRGLLRGFGIEVEGLDGMNEIRAVYGGFPLIMAIGLVLSLWRADLRVAAPLAVAFAMVGMAAGRVISAAVDQSAGKLPVTFLIIEIGIAVALGTAAILARRA